MHVARGFDVAGYVKNLPDGRVEAFVQGTEQEVQGFLDALGRQMSRYIRDTHIRDTSAGDYAEFRIAF